MIAEAAKMGRMTAAGGREKSDAEAIAVWCISILEKGFDDECTLGPEALLIPNWAQKQFSSGFFEVDVDQESSYSLGLLQVW